MSLAHLLARQARVAPDAVAVFDGTQAWTTHAQWAARSAGLALRLREAGLQPGERLVLFVHNHPLYLELLWGVWWAGLTVLPVNAKLHPAEVEWIVGNAGARWAFVSADLAPRPLAERASDDLAWHFCTSGTTGRPKGVMLTQRNLMTMGLTYFVDADAGA